MLLRADSFGAPLAVVAGNDEARLMTANTDVCRSKGTVCALQATKDANALSQIARLL